MTYQEAQEASSIIRDVLSRAAQKCGSTNWCGQDWQAFYLVLLCPESKYLAGLPQRADFAKLYHGLVNRAFNLRLG